METPNPNPGTLTVLSGPNARDAALDLTAELTSRLRCTWATHGAPRKLDAEIRQRGGTLCNFEVIQPPPLDLMDVAPLASWLGANADPLLIIEAANEELPAARHIWTLARVVSESKCRAVCILPTRKNSDPTTANFLGNGAWREAADSWILCPDPQPENFSEAAAQ